MKRARKRQEIKGREKKYRGALNSRSFSCGIKKNVLNLYCVALCSGIWGALSG